MGNVNLTKGELKEFVHGVSKMEKAIYVLNQTQRSCLRQAQATEAAAENIRRQMSNQKIMAKKKLEERDHKILMLRKKPRSVRERLSVIKKWIVEFFKGITDIFSFAWRMGERFACNSDVNGWVVFIVLVIVALPVMLLPLIGNIGSVFALVYIFAVLGIILAVKIVNENRYTREMISINLTQRNKDVKYLSDSSQALTLAESKLLIALDKADLYRKQAGKCKRAADEISRILNKSYTERDIIPVDFRSIDCVMILDFAFRNDLVDTVREGIQYYETRVFRSGVLKGIDTICRRLDQLTSAVSGLRADFYEIQNTIKDLCSGQEKMFFGIDKMRGSQDEILSNQERLLEHTRATQYAVESVRYSIATYNSFNTKSV